MKFPILIVLGMLIGSVSCAEEFGNYTSHELFNDSLIVYAGSAGILIVPYADHMVKVALLRDGFVRPDSSSVVVLEPQRPPWTFSNLDSSLLLTLPEMELQIVKYPLRLRFQANGETLLADERGFFWNDSIRGIRFRLNGNERVYGGGERAIPLNRRGQRLNSYNAPEYCYGFGATDLSITVPFLLSSQNWAVYFDDSYPGYFDIGQAMPDVLEYAAFGGELSCYIMVDDGCSGLLSSFTELTGRQPLPPRWALGFLQSRFGYQNMGEARALVNAFRAQHIPLDAIILDLYWFGWGQMGNFDWDYAAWPNPTDMMRDFDSLGVKTILITEPYILHSSSNYAATAAAGYLAHDSTGQPVTISNFWAGSASLFDVTNPAAADWLWNRYNTLIQQEVGGWWSDLGEPEAHPSNMIHYLGSAARVHNLFSLLWAKRLYEGYRTDYPNVRLFNLIRSGYAGMQRYSTFPWSGDVQRQYAGLQAQIPILLSMGLSGVGYMGSDLGGFSCGPQNSELYIRWMQYGAFSPVMRAHGVDATTEPVYFDPATRAIVSDYIRLRYSLLPYNYTLAYENAISGMPLARPLFMNSSGSDLPDPHDEYLWGSSFLVAPAMEAGQTARNVYLPGGVWLNFWNGIRSEGNRWISVDAPLNRLPLFVKAGSFIPMIPPVETTRDYDTDTLIVNVYPDPSRQPFQYTLYNDDGANANALATGQYETIGFTAQWLADDFDVHLERTHAGWPGAPTTRKIIFPVHGVTAAPSAVTVDGYVIPIVADQAQFEAADSAAFYNPAENRIDIGFLWNNDPTDLRIVSMAMHGSNETLLRPSFALHPCYPNPFNPNTTISFTLPRAGDVKLDIFDITGRHVTTLLQERCDAGSHSAVFNGNGLSSGIYFARLQANQTAKTQKIVLLK